MMYDAFFLHCVVGKKEKSKVDGWGSGVATPGHSTHKDHYIFLMELLVLHANTTRDLPPFRKIPPKPPPPAAGS